MKKTRFNPFTAAGVGLALLVVFLLGGILYATQRTQEGVEHAVRENFTAASLLSRIQVEGEKMRRYEKEMFIYVAVPDRRAGYMKEFDGAYTKLLVLLDEALAPSGRAFSDAERKEIAAWKDAAIFYTNAMSGLASRAAGISSALTVEQRGGLTLEYNGLIGPGKDRFRVLLAGAGKMREVKEAGSQQIAGELDEIFSKLRIGTLLGGLAVVAWTLFALRRRAPEAAAAPNVPMGRTPAMAR